MRKPMHWTPRHYYCQNWRADVSVIIDDSAVLVERIMYSPYGVPFGIPVGDLITHGTGSEPADGQVTLGDSSALTGTYWGSSYNIADLDNDGDVDSSDQSILTSNLGASIAWGALSDTHNRLGYAGYVFDEALAGTKWHVRHRVLESVLGRWIKRDPLGYVDGMGLAAYITSNPLTWTDAMGTQGSPITEECESLVCQIDHTCCNNWDPLCDSIAANVCRTTTPGAAPTTPGAIINNCLLWAFNNPITSGSNKCNDYGKKSYAGVDLHCFCHCAGDSAWSLYVRACLWCMERRGIPTGQAHDECYTKADLYWEAPNWTLAWCLCTCRAEPYPNAQP